MASEAIDDENSGRESKRRRATPVESNPSTAAQAGSNPNTAQVSSAFDDYIKSRMGNLENAPGDIFFTEANALLDMFFQQQPGMFVSVNPEMLLDVFIKRFEEKTLLFASTYPKSDVAGFNTPMATLCRFLHGCDAERVKLCDAIVSRLIKAIPEYARPVPKRAYCIWNGDELSQEHLNNLATFLKLNPDYTLTLLTSKPGRIMNALEKRSDGHWLASCDRFKVKQPDYPDNAMAEGAINRENSGFYANYASGSDIGRMHVLTTKDEDGNSGGLYFDVDCKFHQPLPPLFAPLGVLILQTDGLLMNGIIAAPPDSKILQDVLQVTLQPYDERGKGTWLADIWINKRAGILAPKDDERIEVQADKGKGNAKPRKRQASTYEERLGLDITQYKNSAFQEWTDYLRNRQKSLRENPRRTLTQEITVRPYENALKNKFGRFFGQLSESLNIFAQMLVEDKVFELPHAEEWSKPARAAGRASSVS